MVQPPFPNSFKRPRQNPEIQILKCVKRRDLCWQWHSTTHYLVSQEMVSSQPPCTKEGLFVVNSITTLSLLFWISLNRQSWTDFSRLRCGLTLPSLEPFLVFLYAIDDLSVASGDIGTVLIFSTYQIINIFMKWLFTLKQEDNRKITLIVLTAVYLRVIWGNKCFFCSVRKTSIQLCIKLIFLLLVDRPKQFWVGGGKKVEKK